MAEKKLGFRKIKLCCEQARQEGLQYAWVDTCCIDKRSSAELSEAINSMFNWYARAKVCYIYLADVHHSDPLGPKEWPSTFLQSRWFTRGWTLQELIAPQAAMFYTAEWEWIGGRSDLAEELEKVTGISSVILESGSKDSIRRCSIAERMIWASKWQTTRLEDIAYCLMGLFDINMPLLYGEGSKAFLRLQEEIIRRSDDQTIFAWTEFQGESSGLLAPHPAHFIKSANVRIKQDRELATHAMISLGVSIDCKLFPLEMNTYVAVLQCETKDGQIGIYVCKASSCSQYRRIRYLGQCWTIVSEEQLSNARLSTILIPNEDFALQLRPHAGLPIIRIQSNLEARLFRNTSKQELFQHEMMANRRLHMGWSRQSQTIRQITQKLWTTMLKELLAFKQLIRCGEITNFARDSDYTEFHKSNFQPKIFRKVWL